MSVSSLTCIPDIVVDSQLSIGRRGKVRHHCFHIADKMGEEGKKDKLTKKTDIAAGPVVAAMSATKSALCFPISESMAT
jgi:hypothetical protein